MRVVELKVLDQLVLVQRNAEGQSAIRFRGLCSSLPPFSYEKLNDEFVEQGSRSVLDDVRVWSHRHNLDVDSILDVNGRILIALFMPIPHVFHICSHDWTAWAFPLPADRHAFRALGLHLRNPLLRDVDIASAQNRAAELSDDVVATDSVDLITSAGINMLQNTLRRVFASDPSDDVARQIIWLQRRRDYLLESKLQSAIKGYDMISLVRMLMLAGFMRNMTTLQDAFKFAVACAIRDPAVLKHTVSDLEATRAVPSGRTFFWRQLTVHMGYCVLESEITTRFLELGCVRYFTIDSTPHAGIEKVMHGARIMYNADLVRAFQAAYRMVDPLLDETEMKRISNEFSPMLQWVQGVPSVVGSGRSSMPRKAHAMAHSTRLCCTSWRQTAALINSTGFIVGDQGVESNLAFFKRSLRKLFGRRVANEDAGEDVLELDAVDAPAPADAAPADAAPADAHEDFHIRDEADGGDGPDGFAIRGEEDDRHLPADFAPPEVDDEYLVDLSSSVFFAGILYIMHNTTKGLPAVLVFWPNFVEMFKNVARLVGNKSASAGCWSGVSAKCRRRLQPR